MSLKRVLGLIVFVLLLGVPSQALAQQPTKNPHGQIDIACRSCHSSTAWKPIRGTPDFDHNLQTRFPLRGLHSGLSCVSCHVKPVFNEVGNTCSSCHADMHRRQFGTSCEDCHTIRGWNVEIQSVRQHANRFPLIGAHAAANCESCHRGAASGAFAGLSTACISCHRPDYDTARTIDHKSANVSTACESCHEMSTWRGARFNHRFPLTGAHTSVACQQCHVGGRFTGTVQECIGCHASQYQATASPNHLAAGFSQQCASCHTTSTWKGAQFNHSATRFPLTGRHTDVACSSCHVNNRFAGTPQTCDGCHAANYDRTTNPNHAAAGFPRDCTLCHSSITWQGATFDHSRTRFPLTGAHTTTACATCHVNGQYSGLNTTCAGCHLSRFVAATNPNHVAAGFPQDCQLCHTTTQWTGATFDHSRTRFQLTGAHTTTACASCHVGGRYAGTPPDCYSCHSGVYNSVSNPNHLAAGFPKTCESCHTTTRWAGAQFTHRFPIYSGAHAGKWNSCVDCHTNSSNYSVFSCINCHAHERTKTDADHRSVRNYVYDSLSCYGCHPQGKH